MPSWTHNLQSGSVLLVLCPCGLAHTVEGAASGGLSVVDCVCGRQIEVGHPS